MGGSLAFRLVVSCPDDLKGRAGAPLNLKGGEPRRGVGRGVVGKNELWQRVQPEAGVVLHHVLGHLPFHQLDHLFGRPVSWRVEGAGPAVVHPVPVAQGVNVLGKLVSPVRLEDSGWPFRQPEGFEGLDS